MAANVEYSLDPTQARENHQQNPISNEYRLAVILRAAGVDLDWDYTGQRTQLIAKSSIG